LSIRLARIEQAYHKVQTDLW